MSPPLLRWRGPRSKACVFRATVRHHLGLLSTLTVIYRNREQVMARPTTLSKIDPRALDGQHLPSYHFACLVAGVVAERHGSWTSLTKVLNRESTSEAFQLPDLPTDSHTLSRICLQLPVTHRWPVIRSVLLVAGLNTQEVATLHAFWEAAYRAAHGTAPPGHVPVEGAESTTALEELARLRTALRGLSFQQFGPVMQDLDVHYVIGATAVGDRQERIQRILVLPGCERVPWISLGFSTRADGELTLPAAETVEVLEWSGAGGPPDVQIFDISPPASQRQRRLAFLDPPIATGEAVTIKVGLEQPGIWNPLRERGTDSHRYVLNQDFEKLRISWKTPAETSVRIRTLQQPPGSHGELVRRGDDTIAFEADGRVPASSQYYWELTTSRSV